MNMLGALGKVRVGPKWPKIYSTLKRGTALVAINETLARPRERREEPTVATVSVNRRV